MTEKRETWLNVLGLGANASIEEIQQAYRDLVLVWHPDRFSNNPRLSKQAQDKLKEINFAFEKLSAYKKPASEEAHNKSRDSSPQKSATKEPKAAAWTDVGIKTPSQSRRSKRRDRGHIFGWIAAFGFAFLVIAFAASFRYRKFDVASEIPRNSVREKEAQPSSQNMPQNYLPPRRDLDEMFIIPDDEVSLPEKDEQVSESKLRADWPESSEAMGSRSDESAIDDRLVQQPIIGTDVIVQGDFPPGIGTPIDDRTRAFNGANASHQSYSALKEFAAQSSELCVEQLLNDNSKRMFIASCLGVCSDDKDEVRDHKDALIDLRDTFNKLLVREKSDIQNGHYQYPQNRRHLQIYRDFTKAYALLASQIKSVRDFFESSIRTLKTDPDPKAREIAALQLYGASGVSEKSIPALIYAAESDASENVQFAAVVALGGYGNEAQIVEPELKRLFKSYDKAHDLRIVLYSLAELDSESQIVRKYIHENFIEHRRSSPDVSLDWAIDFLNQDEAQARFAVTDLLNTLQWNIDENDSINPAYVQLLIKTSPNDQRLVKLLETQVRTGSDGNRVYCDSVLKDLRARAKDRAP